MVYVAVAFSDSAAATKTGISQRNHFTHFEWYFCVDWSTAWSFSCALGTCYAPERIADTRESLP